MDYQTFEAQFYDFLRQANKNEGWRDQNIRGISYSTLIQL